MLVCRILAELFQTDVANSVVYICCKIQSAAQGQQFVRYTKVLNSQSSWDNYAADSRKPGEEK